MLKRKEAKPTPQEQFKEFVRTSRKMGLDETGEELEQLFKKLVVIKRPPRTSPPRK